jgi:hypothetical protein
MSQRVSDAVKKIKAAENFPKNSAAQAVFPAPLPKAQRTGKTKAISSWHLATS